MADDNAMIHEENAFKRFLKKIFMEHRWTSMFAYSSLRFPRMIRFLILSTRILTLVQIAPSVSQSHLFGLEE
eukprot:gene45961-61442_t